MYFKLINEFNVTPIKIPVDYFLEFDHSYRITKTQRTNILLKYEKIGETACLSREQGYYKTIVPADSGTDKLINGTKQRDQE